MKIKHVETVISAGSYARSADWGTTRELLHRAIERVEWPAGSGSFTINPVRKGNGVTPIKTGLVAELCSPEVGWRSEVRLDIAVSKKPGALDIVLETPHGAVAVEWETGNISSSHRAVNKMALGLLKGVLAAGVLIVPSRDFYRYLTDRIGNYDELAPYVDLWRSIPCQGVLEFVVIEHDHTSPSAPLIAKGTDGRARG